MQQAIPFNPLLTVLFIKALLYIEKLNKIGLAKPAYLHRSEIIVLGLHVSSDMEDQSFHSNSLMSQSNVKINLQLR